MPIIPLDDNFDDCRLLFAGRAEGDWELVGFIEIAACHQAGTGRWEIAIAKKVALSRLLIRPAITLSVLRQPVSSLRNISDSSISTHSIVDRWKYLYQSRLCMGPRAYRFFLINLRAVELLLELATCDKEG